jgi:Ulp1 family protease
MGPNLQAEFYQGADVNNSLDKNFVTVDSQPNQPKNMNLKDLNNVGGDRDQIDSYGEDEEMESDKVTAGH